MKSLKKKLLINKIKYILYCLIILFISYIFDRFIQMLIFVLFYGSVVECYNYKFHSDTIIKDNRKAVKYCKIITIFVELMFLLLCKDLKISLYLNISVILIFATSDALIQFYVERHSITKDKLGDIDTLKALCLEANLTDIATNRMIMKYIKHKSYEEIAELECVDVDTIRKSLYRSRKKIGL